MPYSTFRYLKQTFWSAILLIFLSFLLPLCSTRVFLRLTSCMSCLKASLPYAMFLRMGEICPKAEPPLTTQKNVPIMSLGLYFPLARFQRRTYLPRNIPRE